MKPILLAVAAGLCWRSDDRKKAHRHRVHPHWCRDVVDAAGGQYCDLLRNAVMEFSALHRLAAARGLVTVPAGLKERLSGF